MLNKKEFNRLVSKIRQQFVWSDTYKNVIKRCTIFTGILRCEGCERYICRTEEKANEFLDGLHASGQVSCEKFAIDHVTPVGTLPVGDLNEAVKRIFCEEANLMGLCMSCHYFKTELDKTEIKEKRSLISKIELGDI